MNDFYPNLEGGKHKCNTYNWLSLKGMKILLDQNLKYFIHQDCHLKFTCWT